MYLLSAVRPMVTGETYTTNRLKKACIRQTVSPKGHLPVLRTPVAGGMTRVAAIKPVTANAMM